MTHPTARSQFEKTGLVKYDAMQRAIIAAKSVDEVKDIRDKVRALELYAQQARNFDSERRAAQIRVRAETKAGELLRAQEKAKPIEKGTKRSGKGGRVISSRDTSQSPKTLKQLGISHDQSSRWQALAENPKAVEKYLREEEDVPTTTGALAAVKQPPKPQQPDPVPEDVLWVWGRLNDFVRRDIKPRSIARAADERFKREMSSALKKVIPMLTELAEVL